MAKKKSSVFRYAEDNESKPEEASVVPELDRKEIEEHNVEEYQPPKLDRKQLRFLKGGE